MLKVSLVWPYLDKINRDNSFFFLYSFICPLSFILMGIAVQIKAGVHRPTRDGTGNHFPMSHHNRPHSRGLCSLLHISLSQTEQQGTGRPHIHPPGIATSWEAEAFSASCLGPCAPTWQGIHASIHTLLCPVPSQHCSRNRAEALRLINEP